MTELDTALEILLRDIENPENQSQYYNQFLDTSFFVPIHDPANIEGTETLNEDDVVPLVIESEGNDYLMLFDTRERMNDWAHFEVQHVVMPGEQLAITSIPPLHWALNAGTDHSKLFLLDEIAWLKGIAGRGAAGAACACSKPAE
jgi:SseB protein N-terminal domain